MLFYVINHTNTQMIRDGSGCKQRTRAPFESFFHFSIVKEFQSSENIFSSFQWNDSSDERLLQPHPSSFLTVSIVRDFHVNGLNTVVLLVFAYFPPLISQLDSNSVRAVLLFSSYIVLRLEKFQRKKRHTGIFTSKTSW